MIVILICSLLLVITVAIHFMCFCWVANIFSCKLHEAFKLVSVVILLFVAHIVEVGVYAGVYYLTPRFPMLGGVEGAILNENLNALYLSLLAFSSLGFSDLIPTGQLRLIVGFEALNGLMLITWSASITFLTMEKVFDWRRKGSTRA